MVNLMSNLVDMLVNKSRHKKLPYYFAHLIILLPVYNINSSAYRIISYRSVCILYWRRQWQWLSARCAGAWPGLSHWSRAAHLLVRQLYYTQLTYICPLTYISWAHSPYLTSPNLTFRSQQ